MNCKTCRFFHFDSYGLTCRRHAPELPIEGYGRWPKVGPEEWCGDYQTVETLKEQLNNDRSARLQFFDGMKCCECDARFDATKDDPYMWKFTPPPGTEGGAVLHYCPLHAGILV